MDDSQTTSAVRAALKAGKGRWIMRLSTDDVSELGLRPSDCHVNARKFTEARGGHVVRGWLVGPNYCIPHSVVDLGGVLREVTPVDVLYDACEFVAEIDVPDAAWNEVPVTLWG